MELEVAFQKHKKPASYFIIGQIECYILQERNYLGNYFYTISLKFSFDWNDNHFFSFFLGMGVECMSMYGLQMGSGHIEGCEKYPFQPQCLCSWVGEKQPLMMWKKTNTLIKLHIISSDVAILFKYLTSTLSPKKLNVYL